MADFPPQGERYKPSINIQQSPRLVVPALYLGTAYGFLTVAAELLIRGAKWVAVGDYGNLRVILAVHIFTLGFLSLTAIGILNQWVPVVFDVLPYGIRRLTIIFSIYVVGMLAFAGGLARQQWFLVAVGGTLLAMAIVFWSGGVMVQLSRSGKAQDAVYRGIQAAVVGFNAVWMLGLFMALGFVGWWPQYPVLRVHIATALVAWMGFLVLTVQQKLNPMFAMSKTDGIRLGTPFYMALGGMLVGWGSLFTSGMLLRVGAILWTAAILMTMMQFFGVVRRGKAKPLDRVFIGLAAAWLLLLGSAGMAIELNPLAVMLAFWGLLTLIFTYQARILPFMVAVALARRLPGPVFKAFWLASAMHSKNQPVVVGGLGWAGAALALWGRLASQPGAVAASGGIALLVVSQISAVAAAMVRGQRQGTRGGPDFAGTSDPHAAP